MMKIVAMRPSSRMVVVRASASPAATAKTLKALNVSKSKLVEEGSTTRNIDGIVYTLAYDSASDKITIIDRVNRLEYDAAVGKDTRISLVEDSARPMGAGAPGIGAGASFDQLVPLLRGDGPGPEIINGRVAMASFFGIAAVEIITGQSLVEQFASPVGAAAAAALALATTVASIAPALTGAVPAERVLPSSSDPHSDRQLQYFWTPLGELINGRVAMLGLLGLAVNEAIRGAALF